MIAGLTTSPIGSFILQRQDGAGVCGTVINRFVLCVQFLAQLLKRGGVPQVIGVSVIHYEPLASPLSLC